MWQRIVLGSLGLFMAFSAGGHLQSWIDEGKVWHKSKTFGWTLLSYDETPISYVSQISYYILITVGGLLFVWLALGPKKRS
jgi:hypothetical protein